jgi:hypothetical protein
MGNLLGTRDEGGSTHWNTVSCPAPELPGGAERGGLLWGAIETGRDVGSSLAGHAAFALSGPAPPIRLMTRTLFNSEGGAPQRMASNRHHPGPPGRVPVSASLQA